MALTGADDPRDRSAPKIRGQVNLGTHTTSATTQTLTVRYKLRPRIRILVIRPSPLCYCQAAAKPPTQSKRAPQRECPSAAHAGHQRRDDGPESPCRPHPAPTHRHRSRRHHRRSATHRAPPARCHHQTSGGVGCRPSSNSRNRTEDHATASPSESATSPRPRPGGDPSTGRPEPASDPETTAPKPTNSHHSSHDGYAPQVLSRSQSPHPRDTP